MLEKLPAAAAPAGVDVEDGDEELLRLSNGDEPPDERRLELDGEEEEEDEAADDERDADEVLEFACVDCKLLPVAR